MLINDLYRPELPYEEINAQMFCLNGETGDVDPALLSEHVMDVYINDTLSMKLSCTPEYLPELVLGRLISEGIISSADEVKALNICKYGSQAHVYLVPERASSVRQTGVTMTPTCCTDNKVFCSMVGVGNSGDREPSHISFSWEPKWIYMSAEVFKADTPLHGMTHSTHSAYLYREGELLFMAEDIGRHNAMDKVLGYALRNCIELSECYVYTSGRVPTDMMNKIVRAGVPMLISKEVPTIQAIEMAKEAGITLIGRARESSFVAY